MRLKFNFEAILSTTQLSRIIKSENISLVKSVDNDFSKSCSKIPMRSFGRRARREVV